MADRLEDANQAPEAPRPWAETLTPLIPGATQSFIEQNLLAVLRDFFMVSNAWLVDTATIEVVPGQADYTVPSPVAATNIGLVLAVQTNDGRSLWPMDRIGGFWQRGRDLSSYYCPSPGVIRFMMILDNTASFTALVSLVPTTIELPRDLREQYQGTLEAGVMGKMLMLPNRPWTDIRQGTLLWRQYLNGRNIARVTAMRAFTPAGHGWQFPRFGV